MRLFCFPHAGGGAAAYRSWPDLIGEDIDIVAVRLPGRENRVVERRYRRMADAVTDLCPVIRPLLTLPYAFFGHSLGTLVAFALACRLDEGDAPAAAHLFAAASRAPHAPPRGPALYDLPAGALIEQLRAYGGMPAEVLEQRDLLQVLLPTIRDDFELGETYRPARAARLGCPVTALGGAADETVSRQDLAAWQDVTTGPFELAVVPGGHFAASRAESGVTALVGAALRQGLPARRSG